MALICSNCGKYSLKNSEKSLTTLKCCECAAEVPANILPLFIITGASGAGKTSVLPELRARIRNAVIMDADLLWAKCAEGQFLNNWLKIAYSNAQSGYYTVLCGTVMPWDLDKCEDRDLVMDTYFLNLHCSDEDRATRLRNRPEFRGTNERFIEEHRKFAHWLVENAGTEYEPPMPIVNTSENSKGAAADLIAQWIKEKIGIESKEPTLAPGS